MAATNKAQPTEESRSRHGAAEHSPVSAALAGKLGCQEASPGGHSYRQLERKEIGIGKTSEDASGEDGSHGAAFDDDGGAGRTVHR